MTSQELAQIADHHSCSIAQVIFRFALEVGMIPLTGTTNAQHMQLDLEIFDLLLEADEIERIAHLGYG